jgi:O-antigen/teichoic acid export membrane protein
VAFAATIVVARALGPVGFGEVVLAVSTATLVGALLDLTLEEAVVYHGYRALEAGHFGALRSLIRRSFAIDLAVGVAVALVIVLSAEPLAELVSDGRLDADLLRLAALTGLAVTVNGTTGGMLLVAGRPDLRAWIMAVSNSARLGGVLVAVQLGGPAAVVVSYTIAAVIAATFQAFLAWRIGWSAWRAGGALDGEPVGSRALISFGFHTSLSKTLAVGHERLIPVLLGSLAGPTAVGLFRVGLLPVVVATLIAAPIGVLLLPEQAKLAAGNHFEAVWRSVRAHTIAAVALGVPAAVLGWFALDTLIPLLYSQEFAGAVDTSRILLIAAVAQLATSWWLPLPVALGRPELRTIATAGTLLLTIALLIPLAGRGSEGAALAFSLAALITAIAWIFSARLLLRRAQAGVEPADDSDRTAGAIAPT